MEHSQEEDDPMSKVLPEPEEYAALVPRPGDPVWRSFSDVRMLSTSVYATLLQVAHPTVGHGVHQYSSFTKDPWGRLFRTLDYVHGTIYGGPEMAGRIGKRVREMHRTIRGTKPDGDSYSAMEPDAFAWVHATLAAVVVQGRATFAKPMDPAEQEAFWASWMNVGRLIGVRERDLPERFADFWPYFDGVVENDLTWTPAVPEVLATLERPTTPPVPGMPTGLWRVISRPVSGQMRVTTTGLMPPVLRERLGLRFTRRDERIFRAITRGAKMAGPVVRGPLAEFGPYYIRWRSEALERGDVAAAPPAARDTVPA
jgi:uncharacterized protein (DUF2236 family)